MAILFRNLQFINSVLVNSEVWYPLKEDDLDELEAVDKLIMRRILDAPSSTNSALLYLELGCIPLKHIIKCRRLMYLHYLLRRQNDELLHNFFKAMTENPTPGDWIELVQKDLKDFDIKESFIEISKRKKENFKKKVKSACKAYSLKILKSEIKSKGENLSYNALKTQKYLKSQQINTNQAKLLFRIRTRMLNVKCNYKKMYENKPLGVNCSVCFEIPEDQEHAVTCSKLPEQFNLPYKNLFSSNESKMLPALYLFEKVWRRRDEYLYGYP